MHGSAQPREANMANIPVRGLGSAGIITDVPPHELPPNAFSDGNNVIFDDNKIMRAPAFKALFDQISVNPVAWSASTTTYANNNYTWSGATAASQAVLPRLVAAYRHPTNGPVVLVANDDGNVFDYASGTLSVLTPSTVNTSVTSAKNYTHCEVSGLSVVNRDGHTSYVRDIVGGGNYDLMTDGDWPSTYHAKSMRSFKDFLLALNVYNGTSQQHAMVKWTDPIQYREATANITWTSSATNSAGDNILGQARTPIVDGLALNNVFIIYTETESFLMEYTASSLVFSFRELFTDDGVISVNCIAAAGNSHYVFGNNDIYQTNGQQKQSIADGKVRRRIYKEIDRSKTDRCFVHHDEQLDLIYFAYVSRESDIGYTGSTYANRAAVYNLKNGTWSFMDLPNIVGAAITSHTTTLQPYNTATGTYANTSASYNAHASKTATVTVMVGARDNSLGLTVSRIYAVEMLDGASFAINQEPETIQRAFVERTGIDVDETQAPLRSMKVMNSVIPQVRTVDNEHKVEISLGSTDFPSTSAPNYEPAYNFYPFQHTQVNSRASGRLLAYKIEENDGNFFEVAGSDFEITIQGQR